MKKNTVLLLFLLLSFLIHAQYPYFYETHEFQPITNPALSGADSALSFNSAYSFPGKNVNMYRTYFASLSNYFCVIGGGVGMNYLSRYHEETNKRMSSFHFNYAPQFTFSDQWTIRAGFQLNSLTELSVDGVKTSTQDYSAGLLLYNHIFYGGMAVYHFAPVPLFKGSAVRFIPLQFVYHTGFNVDVNRFRMSPNLVCQVMKTGYYRFVGELTGKYNWMILGGNVEYTSKKTKSLSGIIGLQNAFVRMNYTCSRHFATAPQPEYPIMCMTEPEHQMKPEKSPCVLHEIRLSFFIPHSKPSKIKGLRLIGNVLRS